MSKVATIHTKGTRAFTLVEVLIGILILGIGLLGLSAVFPAVMAQQRSASDAVEGTAAAESAEAFLKSHVQLSTQYLPPFSQDHTNTPANYRGWEALVLNQQWCPDGTWQLIYDDSGAMALNPATGELSFAGGTPITIPVRDRLLPRPTFTNTDTGFGSARFVWDVAARRVIRRPQTGTVRGWRDRLQDQVEVAVFVRRIDPGIRVRAGNSYVPVAEDERGLPTYDGRGDSAASGTSEPNYSVIRVNSLAPYLPGGGATPPDRIALVYVSDESPLLGLDLRDVESVMSQIGQRFVTPKGDVIRVVGVEWLPNVGSAAGTEKRPVMRIEPAVPYEDFDTLAGPAYAKLNVLYTPQVPVGIKVFRLRSGGAL